MRIPPEWHGYLGLQAFSSLPLSLLAAAMEFGLLPSITENDGVAYL